MTDFKKGLKDGIPIALGYISVSFTFGLQAVGVGLAWWEAVMISFTNITSAGQFAGLDIMVRGGGFWMEMACTQFIINLRYALMSLSLSQKTDKSVKGIHRWIIGFGITDEIFAVATKEDEIKRSYFAGLATLPYLGWALGTFIGAILGNILPDRLMSALSVAIYGMFVAVVVPEMKKARPVLIVVIIAIILSCLFYYIPLLSKISSGITITIVAITAAIIGSIFFPISDEADNSNN